MFSLVKYFAHRMMGEIDENKRIHVCVHVVWVHVVRVHVVWVHVVWVHVVWVHVVLSRVCKQEVAVRILAPAY